MSKIKDMIKDETIVPLEQGSGKFIFTHKFEISEETVEESIKNSVAAIANATMQIDKAEKNLGLAKKEVEALEADLQSHRDVYKLATGKDYAVEA